LHTRWIVFLDPTIDHSKFSDEAISTILLRRPIGSKKFLVANDNWVKIASTLTGESALRRTSPQVKYIHYQATRHQKSVERQKEKEQKKKQEQQQRQEQKEQKKAGG
jgi:hypothetical protein